jgi:hypothetical protein
MKVLLILCFAWLLGGSAKAEMAYIYSGMGEIESRDDFVSMLLIGALDRTVPVYGPYSLRKIAELPRNRQIWDLENGGGDINFAILGTAQNISEHLRPILIPIDKGMAGYRVLMIRHQQQPAFAATRTLDDLKKYNYGQGFSWDDVDILKANGLRVTTGDNFEGLYLMLARKRFDAFPRGLSEIVPEFRLRGPAHPELQIEKTLLLFYPLPLYFWFSRDAKGEALAKRLEEGLWGMINDGSYDTLFWKYNRSTLEGLDMPHRRVLVLNNPLLPPQTPLGDPRLWISPDQLGLMDVSH